MGATSTAGGAQSVTCQNPDTRKKRDWKAINARRVPAEMCERGVSRHQWEQIKRATFLSTYSKKGPAIERLKNGETLPQVLRDLDAEHYPDRSKWPETDRKIQKLWKCLLKAAKDYGCNTQLDQAWFVLSRLMERNECRNPDTLKAISSANHDQIEEVCQEPDADYADLLLNRWVGLYKKLHPDHGDTVTIRIIRRQNPDTQTGGAK